MKKYIIMLSTKFPKTHKKSGEPTGFPLAIKHYDKIHTIRANYELWRKRFIKIDEGKAMLSVRVWEGQPYNSKQLEIFKYDKTHKIGIERLVLAPACFTTNYPPMPTINYQFFSSGIINDLAKNDGLTTEDFEEWFKKYDKTQPMAIIHFTGFRYNLKP